LQCSVRGQFLRGLPRSIHFVGKKMKQIQFLCVLFLLLAAPGAADPEIDDMIDGLVGPILKSFSLPSFFNVGDSPASQLPSDVDNQPTRMTIRFFPLDSANGPDALSAVPFFSGIDKLSQNLPSSSKPSSASTFSLVPPAPADAGDNDLFSMLEGQMRSAAAMREAQPRFSIAPRASGRASMPSLKSLFGMPMFSGKSSFTTIVNDGKTTQRTTVTTDENGQETHTTQTYDNQDGEFDVGSLLNDMLSLPKETEVCK
jgi:hypothetical protein